MVQVAGPQPEMPQMHRRQLQIDGTSISTCLLAAEI